ncbi:MAG: integrase core domain-containing protein [Terriglobia bacterium]
MRNTKTGYSPFTIPDYYMYANDLVIERNVPGKPHTGKVLAAIQAHVDDLLLLASGTVAKLIDEGYTGYLIRFSNDEASGRTLRHGVAQNEIDNENAAKAMGCKKAFTFYYRNHRMDDGAIIELRARLIHGELLICPEFREFPASCYHVGMRDLVILFVHFLTIAARLASPGGFRSVVAESVLVKHQLLILNRSRQRAPHPCFLDRLVAGWCALFMRPSRLIRSAIVLRPSTLLHLHRILIQRKYRLPFFPKGRRKPGPRGPNKELIEAVVQIKQRNPTWVCPRIAQQIAWAFDIPIDKDVVRRILARHYRPGADAGGPSWLTFLGHLKDSLWSVDLFPCESATLRTHWVLVVMDQFTRRILGIGVHAGTVDGVALCRMFNRAIRGQRGMPKDFSSDHDPRYRFGQWQANLRILEVTEIKTVPYVPPSHPFVERLLGTLCRECLDRTLFWTTADLESKLRDFKSYFNHQRTHSAGAGRPPDDIPTRPVANLQSYRWESHCRGLYQAPMAA